MKKLTLLTVLVLCSFCLFAAPLVNAKIIDNESPFYDYVDYLYALSNKAKPETNRPWSEAQARMILADIDKAQLTGQVLTVYEKAEEILNEGHLWNISDDFGFSVDPQISIEGYLHTNSEDFDDSTDWVRSYADRKPWVKVGFDFSVSDFFWTVSDIQYRIARGSHKDNWTDYVSSGKAKLGSDGNYYVGSYVVTTDSNHPESEWFFKNTVATNFTVDTYDFDFIFPHRAIVSVGGKNWNVSVNRDRMKIGDAHIGNLLVDDYSDYNDYLNFSLFSKKFDYNWYMMFFNTLTNDSEVMTNEARMFLIHTLNFRILDRVSFKVSENVMYKYSTFDFQFLNPAFIYHNLNNRAMFNAIALVEANVAVFPGLNVYGQYALDQARAPNEGYGQSDASGLILGAEYTVPAAGGIFENYAEFANTTPLLYRRDGVDFIKASRYYHQGSANDYCYGHFPVFEYIGFPFGGDTQALVVGSKYTMPGLLTAEVSATALQHGQMSIFASHNKDGKNDDSADIGGKTPSGDVITRALVLSAKADVSLEEFVNTPKISFQFESDFITKWNFTKETKEYSKAVRDLQISLGVTCKL